ncbi:uncharacterized protein [Temnothorax longispinosus]
MFIFSSTIILMGAQIGQNFINIILSANVSRPHHLQISTEYFLDQKVYFYLPFFHINIAMAIGCIAIVATGTMLIAYLQHACGMFEIASYRIERAIQFYVTKNINLQSEIRAYKGIIHAVDIHRKATTFSNHLISEFEISFMFLILVGVLSLSLNIFRVFQIVLIEYNTEELLVNLIFAFMCFIYMFLSNFVGQQIIDHNNHVFLTAYKVQWYSTPLPVQKLILFLLQRGNKSFGLHVGGLFIASLECFSTFTTFVTTDKCTTDDIIKIFALSSGIICIAIKYNSFCVNSNTIKNLMEQLQCIYDDIMDKNEITIIDRYGDIANRYTITFTICLFCSVSVITITQLWPDFNNIILSANKSRSYRLQVSTECFIDQEKYYYLLLLHINLAIFIGLTVLVATGSMLIAFLQHACGMFKIASYRVKNAIDIYISNIKLKNKSLVCKGLIYGVHIHRKAMMFSEYLISRFEISFMFLIAFGVITLSLNTFRLFQILSSTYGTEELPITLVTTSVCFTYMFLSNFIGQEIIDHYNLIFVTAYEAQWYITPLYIQKLIQFLLLKGNKSFGLNVGGLFISSLQCFATLANASLSYFIVIYSMQ